MRKLQGIDKQKPQKVFSRIMNYMIIYEIENLRLGKWSIQLQYHCCHVRIIKQSIDSNDGQTVYDAIALNCRYPLLVHMCKYNRTPHNTRSVV